MDLSASSVETDISGVWRVFFDAIASGMGANAYQYEPKAGPKGSPVQIHNEIRKILLASSINRFSWIQAWCGRAITACDWSASEVTTPSLLRHDPGSQAIWDNFIVRWKEKETSNAVFYGPFIIQCEWCLNIFSTRLVHITYSGLHPRMCGPLMMSSLSQLNELFLVGIWEYCVMYDGIT